MRANEWRESVELIDFSGSDVIESDAPPLPHFSLQHPMALP